MPKIKVNDINLYYETHGQGAPLIFIAGFTADLTGWANVIDVYVNNYQVIVFDNRGVGRSDCPDQPYSIAMMAQDVIALCDALNIKKANFVGNSMGGKILQYIASEYPQYIIAMVLSNTYNKFGIRCVLYSKMQKKTHALGIASDPLFIAANLGFVYSDKFLNQPGIIENLVDKLSNYPYAITEIGYCCQLNALLKTDSTNLLDRIKAPCLVLSADEDIITPPRQAEQLALAIPNAEYYCFTDCGHLPHIEYPELFNKVVLDFLHKYNKHN